MYPFQNNSIIAKFPCFWFSPILYHLPEHQRLTDSKLEELKLFDTNLHSDVDGLIITETFCQPKILDSYYSIPDFNLHRKDRVGKSGGGIVAWIMNSLEQKRRMDLESDKVETLRSEVFPYKSKHSLLTAGVYRSPSNNTEEDKMVGSNIENAYLLNKEMILRGDFNVILLCYTELKKHHCENFTQLRSDVNSITRPLSKTCLSFFCGGGATRCTMAVQMVTTQNKRCSQAQLRSVNLTGTGQPFKC